MDELSPEQKAKKRPKAPDDFKDADEFVAHARKLFSKDLEADKVNRMADLEDRQFLAGKQWPEWVKARRDAANKPVMTFNHMPAFIGQVIGSRRLNETDIKVTADFNATKAVAEIREGLVRHIQNMSIAQTAYNVAHQSQVAGGVGYFQVKLQYAYDDVFEQDIIIDQIPNSASVVIDRQSIEPTAKDARHGFVYDHIPHEDFKAAWPWATPADMVTDASLLGDLRADGWIRQDDVRIVSFWRIRTRTRTLALFNDGTTKYIDDMPEEQWMPLVQQRPDGTPFIREAKCKYAQMYLMSGSDLLEGPYDLPIDRIPIFRAMGWELYVGEERHRWGIVRFLKDPARLHNYARSAKGERLALATKAQWLASSVAVQGREKDWREAHLTDDKLLIYNAEAANPPTLVPPAQLEPAWIEESQASLQDMRDISNLHEASLGQQSNEVSGKAIIARQRVGELGTVLYQQNLNLAIEECGRVCNQLVSFVYDTPRIIMITGPDDKDLLVPINQPGPGDSILNDLTQGKYKTKCVTGPSSVTKRAEAAEGMMNLINAAPQVMAAAADKIVEAQDWPGSNEIARRLRKTMPPGMVDPQDMSQSEQQQLQETMQAQQQAALVQAATIKASLDKLQAEVKEIEAKRDLHLAQAEKARAEPAIKAAAEHAKAASTQFNDHITALEHDDGTYADRNGDKDAGSKQGS